MAEIDGQFSAEESAPLADGMRDRGDDFERPKPPLKPDCPAAMTSRFEPRRPGEAFKALDLLSKIPGAKFCGGMVELDGKRAEGDYLSLRFGPGIAVAALEIDRNVKELTALLGATQPAVSLRLDSITFPSGRDLTNFCDAMEIDFDAVQWKQD